MKRNKKGQFVKAGKAGKAGKVKAKPRAKTKARSKRKASAPMRGRALPPAPMVVQLAGAPARRKARRKASGGARGAAALFSGSARESVMIMAGAAAASLAVGGVLSSLDFVAAKDNAEDQTALGTIKKIVREQNQRALLALGVLGYFAAPMLLKGSKGAKLRTRVQAAAAGLAVGGAAREVQLQVEAYRVAAAKAAADAAAASSGGAAPQVSGPRRRAGALPRLLPPPSAQVAGPRYVSQPGATIPPAVHGSF